MGKLLHVLVALLLWTVGATAGEAPDMTGPATVGSGDTLMIGETLIRLAGIDAPEAEQTCTRDGADWPCGEAAIATLRSLVADRTVTCGDVMVLSDGVVRARCAAGEVDLAEKVLSEGMAVVEGERNADYASAEATARASGAGIWAGSFETPAKWREAHACSCSARKKAFLDNYARQQPEQDAAATAN